MGISTDDAAEACYNVVRDKKELGKLLALVDTLSDKTLAILRKDDETIVEFLRAKMAAGGGAAEGGAGRGIGSSTGGAETASLLPGFNAIFKLLFWEIRLPDGTSSQGETASCIGESLRALGVVFICMLVVGAAVWQSVMWAAGSNAWQVYILTFLSMATLLAGFFGLVVRPFVIAWRQPQQIFSVVRYVVNPIQRVAWVVLRRMNPTP